MEIKILKKEDGEIIFNINGEENKFEYDNFDKLIEVVYNNDEIVSYDVPEELKEYKELLDGIIKGARTQDYREAVRMAKEASNELLIEENAEKQ